MAKDQTKIATTEELYLRNFSCLRELTQSDPHMRFDESERLIESIAEHLGEYDGPHTDIGFREWAANILVPALGFYGIKYLCEKSVRDAIRKTFLGYEWRGDTIAAAQDAEQNTWIWVLANIQRLLAPTAKPRRWLAKIAKYEAMTIRLRMQRENKRFASGLAVGLLGRDFKDKLVYEQPLEVKKDAFDVNESRPYIRAENATA